MTAKQYWLVEMPYGINPAEVTDNSHRFSQRIMITALSNAKEVTPYHWQGQSYQNNKPVKLFAMEVKP